MIRNYLVDLKGGCIMKNWNVLIATILLLSATVFAAQAALPEKGSLNAANASLTLPNVKELVTFVDSAVAYVKENGKEKALKEFNNKTGPFVKGELYIFALDFNGTPIATFKKDLIGKNLLNQPDANGVQFRKNEINALRKNENGFFDYLIFPNPAHNNKNELKLAYERKVDDNWYVGSGIYLSNVSANFSIESRNNLTNFVESAVKYAKDNGKDKALKAFNDKNSTFFKKGLYVFALDFAGNSLANPTRPDIIGKNRIDIKDSNGVEHNRNMITLAQNGGGFTYYIYPDPARNMTPGLKLSYIKKVDDTWWLAAGIYAP
jgi:signal transduction histidine kinase